MVLVHDDGPRATLRMAIFDNLSEGNDDLARAESIGTSTGYKNRASAELYPLEVSWNETDQGGPPRTNGAGKQATAVADSSIRSRSCRATASETLTKISEWTRAIRLPQEDVENFENNFVLFCCGFVFSYSKQEACNLKREKERHF